MDLYGLPKETLEVLLPIRILNHLILGFLFFLTFKELFHRHYNKILFTGYLCSGFTICFGVFLSQPGEYSHDAYFAGLMILIMTAFSWSYLPIRFSIYISTFFISLYIGIKTYIHQDTEGTRLFILTSHTFFLISVVIIAAVAQYIRDTLITKNLKLQQSLKSMVEAKTREAKKQANLANMDPLTGIPNRRYIIECLKTALEEAKKTHSQLTIVFIDLNGFKKINDTHGHEIGDKVLEITAKRLARNIREDDFLARLGGDEFLVGFKTKEYSANFIHTHSNLLRVNITSPMVIDGLRLQVGTSIGIANFPADGDTIEEIIKVADEHMYIEKTQMKQRLKEKEQRKKEHKNYSFQSI